jgi:hypothetical protein
VDTLERIAQELLRLYEWRREVADVDEGIMRYGREKKAAWDALRVELADRRAGRETTVVELSCQDACDNCGAADRHLQPLDAISWDENGDARCSECGAPNVANDSDVCCRQPSGALKPEATEKAETARERVHRLLDELIAYESRDTPRWKGAERDRIHDAMQQAIDEAAQVEHPTTRYYVPAAKAEKGE